MSDKVDNLIEKSLKVGAKKALKESYSALILRDPNVYSPQQDFDDLKKISSKLVEIANSINQMVQSSSGINELALNKELSNAIGYLRDASWEIKDKIGPY